jgi:PBSX family phage terminase large subunit
MDPYQLLPGQTRFLKMQEKYRAFVGGVGSGKTWVGSLLALARFTRGESGIVVAPTYRMLKDSTLVTLLGMIDAHNIPVVYNKGDQQLETMVNGKKAIAMLRSGDNPDRLRGPNVTWGWVDEMAMVRENVWKVLLGRLRVGDPQAWGTTTPAGMNWVYQRWVERQDPRYGIVQSSTRENKFLPKDFVTDLESDYTSEFAAQEVDGQFVAFEGLVYSEFNSATNLIDYDPPKSWARYGAIDFGYSNPFVHLWGAVDEDGRLYIYDEHYQRKALLETHAEAIKSRGVRQQWIVSDHDAQEVAQMRSLGIDTVPAKKDITVGIQAVKARLKPAGDGRPRLFIHERCVNLRKELGMYRWPESKDGSPEKEAPVKEWDHACDALRYMVASLDLKDKVRRVAVRGI